MMRTAAFATAAVFAAAAPATALADEPPRLAKYVDTFSSPTPSTSAARFAETDLYNPNDPDGKPYAVSHVHVELAPGTVVNTRALTECEAGDGELMARGAAACPASSVVGSGMVDVDTGFPGDARHVLSDIVFVNARDQLVFVFTERGSGAHVVVRGHYSNGNVLDVDIPPLPGAPPDGGADTHEVIDLEEHHATSDGRRVNYITTPPACPSSGKWTNTLTYTFRDGVTQTFTTTTPCDRGGGAATASPRVRIGGVQRKRCTRRFIRPRVSLRPHERLERVDLYVGHRRVKRVRQYEFRTRLDVRRLRPGRHRLTAVARLADGGKVRATRRFSRC